MGHITDRHSPTHSAELHLHGVGRLLAPDRRAAEKWLALAEELGSPNVEGFRLRNAVAETQEVNGGQAAGMQWALPGAGLVVVVAVALAVWRRGREERGRWRRRKRRGGEEGGDGGGRSQGERGVAWLQGGQELVSLFGAGRSR